MDIYEFIFAVVPVLAGVVVGGLITYFITRRQDSNKLRKDLQIETSNIILKDIKNIQTKLFQLMSLILVDDNIFSKYSEEKEVYQIIVDEYMKHRDDLTYLITNFIYEFESKLIILKDFIENRDKILEIYAHLQQVEIKITTSISNSSKTQEFNEAKAEYLYLSSQLSLELLDFNHKLQNMFLGQLFKNKISKEDFSHGNYEYMSDMFENGITAINEFIDEAINKAKSSSINESD